MAAQGDDGRDIPGLKAQTEEKLRYEEQKLVFMRAKIDQNRKIHDEMVWPWFTPTPDVSHLTVAVFVGLVAGGAAVAVQWPVVCARKDDPPNASPDPRPCCVR